MKLEKINYKSAVVFGLWSLVMYFVFGISQWIAREQLLAIYGLRVTALSAFVTAPIAGGIAAYLTIVVAIAIYNSVAKRYPISWIVKK